MPYKKIDDQHNAQRVKKLLSDFMGSLQSNSKERSIRTKAGQIRYQEFYLANAKHILDKIDHLLANHYGFTEEEPTSL